MPFVLRRVEPRFLCRGHVPAGSTPQCWPVGAELEAIANGALTTSLKQLASLLTTAEDIFAELTVELTAVADRSSSLRQRLDKVEERLASVDPKKIPVPESDISTFAARTEHFHIINKSPTSLFTPDTRPKALKELYEAAAVVALRSLDNQRRNDSSMDMFLCTPVLGKRRRGSSLDIESRIPAAIEDLRRWTSTEALGDVTVPPDCMSRILGNTTTDDAVDHKLPSPEEQVQAIALKFPAEIVAVDVSGKGFERMSMRRRSLLPGPESQEATVKRRPRRPRGKRRNTIAGIDQKEIRQAVGVESTGEEAEETVSSAATRAHRSASTDILGSSRKEPSTEKKSHFNTLKAWGMLRLKLISPKSSQQQSEQHQSNTTSNTDRAGSRRDKNHERKPSYSSSSGKSISSIMMSVSNSDRQTSVKLRESAAQRRERRKGTGSRDEPPHSSSGNWSASSESGRASIGSETTTTTQQPRSTTTASIGTSSTSLNHVRRPKGRDTSTSSSVTSEGTLTPDIIQDITVIPFSDDGETSSVYSCDTEGYYTSFHVDSGLKTLREEDPLPQTPLTKSNEVSSDPTSPIVENEYELFGRGSTSTTTSSAGTVCTALMAPPPPERKSSLTVVAMVHGQNPNGGDSPDSGHNTSSSPVESASSPACTGRSCSEFEYSEASDLEGCERIERIRSKTAINSSRIPSMCVITPPVSDDEQPRESEQLNKKIISRSTDLQTAGSLVMSATVGTSKMEVINGQDKNLYATIQVLPSSTNEKPSSPQNQSAKTSPLSGVLGKLRGVLPGKKHALKSSVQEHENVDSGDYVTIADVRNNNNKRQETAASSNISTTPACFPATYANSDVFKKDAEYVSLSELPKKPDSSLERKRQGARVTLDSEGKVVYSSDSLKRRRGSHTTFNPGPFVKENVSPNPSPLLHRAIPNVRAVMKSSDTIDGLSNKSTPPTSPQLGKVIIRAARSPDRSSSPDFVRTPTTVVGPNSLPMPHRHVRGAYVNMQDEEDNSILAIDPVSSHEVVQSPSYITLPVPEDCQKGKIQEYLKDAASRQKVQCDRQQGYNREQMLYAQKIHVQDSQWPFYENKLYDQNNVSSSGNDFQHAFFEQRQIVHARNTRNLQHYVPVKNANQFYTLPSRRPHRDVEPPRSVTPDITRGLGRGSLSAMHVLARHGQKTMMEQPPTRYGSSVELSTRNPECSEAGNKLISNQQQQPMVDIRNRFATPLGLTALGYRFFASSPVHDPVTKSPSADALKHNPISPIRRSHGNSFKLSTPTGRSTPTVAERLAVSDSNRGPLSMPNSGKNTPVHNHAGRNTPTSITLSPTKSSMSNEELFAAIHKSKKRLNIKGDNENQSSYGLNTLLATMSPGSRHSWSSESQKPSMVSQNTPPPSAITSRLNFKRLLLQQSVKTAPSRPSAAEQLKLSRQQCQQQSSPNAQQTTPLAKVLSPRSMWRFQTPRTDVLSSTIIEDTAAEEKAMKPSPENISPVSRVNVRRQLDLSNDLSERFRISHTENNIPDTRNDSVSIANVNPCDFKHSEEAKCIETNNKKSLVTDNRVSSTLPTSTKMSGRHPQGDITPTTAIQCLSNNSQLTPSCQQAISAFESRRISNQLARAQFLSGTSVSASQSRNVYAKTLFRSRSESPKNSTSQNVSRSTSVPTLETAL